MTRITQQEISYMEEHVPKALAVMFATLCTRTECAAYTDPGAFCTTQGGRRYGFHRERQDAAGVVDKLGNYLPEYVG